MSRFIPLIDNNNKTVLQWTMIDSHGVEIVKSVPKTMWKLQKDWSDQEINAFFDVEPSTAKSSNEEEDLEDRVEELEDTIEELKDHIEKKTF